MANLNLNNEGSIAEALMNDGLAQQELDISDDSILDGLLEGEDRLDLFQPTEAVAESTLPKTEAESGGTEALHNMLMAAGMTPGYGIVADAADAILYSFEGEFGAAAWSLGAAAPIVGQYVAGQRMLKKAHESGDTIHKIFRGVDNWYQGKMVKDGMHVSEGARVGPHFRDPSKKLTAKDLFYTTTNPQHAANYGRFADEWNTKKGVLLEFHVPESYIRNVDVFDMHGNKLLKDSRNPASPGHYHFGDYNQVAVFAKGLPKEFLTKVHKYGDEAVSPKGLVLPLKGDLQYKGMEFRRPQ